MHVHWVSKGQMDQNWIVGGFAGDGTPFYICHGYTQNTETNEKILIPGKYFLPTGSCYVPLNGNEITLDDFTVLAKKRHDEVLRL